MRRSVALIAMILLASGCAAAPPADVASFTLEYGTGSIPPPYNYEYRITGTAAGGELAVEYQLTYRFRESMSDEEIIDAGYSPDDDITWSGTLTGSDQAAWLDLARRTQLRTASPNDNPPGSDSIEVTITDAVGGQRSGIPAERAEWQQLAAALDQRARLELGHARDRP